MQAGETLDFILPFNGAEREANDSEEVSAEDLRVLALIQKRFIEDRAEHVHFFTVFAASGLETVYESSNRLDMEDGSYLHIAVYGAQSDDGPISFGISVNEHLSDGSYNGGHSYVYTPDGLTRSTSFHDAHADLSDEDREMLKYHYMPSDFHAELDHTETEKHSDDPEVRMHAEMMQRREADEMQFDEIASQAGYNNQPPYPGELEKLCELIWHARPFPLHLADAE